MEGTGKLAGSLADYVVPVCMHAVVTRARSASVIVHGVLARRLGA